MADHIDRIGPGNVWRRRALVELPGLTVDVNPLRLLASEPTPLANLAVDALTAIRGDKVDDAMLIKHAASLDLQDFQTSPHRRVRNVH